MTLWAYDGASVFRSFSAAIAQTVVVTWSLPRCTGGHFLFRGSAASMHVLCSVTSSRGPVSCRKRSWSCWNQIGLPTAKMCSTVAVC